jgi:endonuclease YncB( thermonuclease family)
MPKDNLTRPATYIRVIDGDTFVAKIPVWQGVKPAVFYEASIRVKGWSAAELNEPEGLIMRDAFESMLRAAKTIDLTFSTMSFERLVCAVFLDDQLFAGLLHQRLHQLRTTNTTH